MAVSDELVRAGSTLGITVTAVFLLIVAAGFWLLRRRSARPVPAAAQAAAQGQQRANILLVRLDDAIAAGEEELGFATAQFGAGVVADYARALAGARERLTEAFSLQQKLDDALPDSLTQRRDWTARIIRLCEDAQASLDAEGRRFDELRQLDKNAAANLAAVRELIRTLETRRPIAGERLRSLREGYAGTAVASVSDNLQRADAALSAARESADAAEAALGETSATTAVDAVRSATDDAHLAGQLFDAIDTLAEQLSRASDAVATLAESTRLSLDEARALRDAPPDAAAGAAVGKAIEIVRQVLSGLDTGNPLAALDQLRDANAALDSSLAWARNQQRRLDGAREALAGALVAARSQLTVTRDFISGRRGRVGPEARTRLAEAERLLVLAEAEADPVMALDTARSSATYSRDADALARYDVR